MDHLLRTLAPVSDAAWTLLDAEARSRLVVALGARKLVDFAGPHGWQHSATNLGRTEPVADTPTDQVRARRRRVLPLVEVRADFDVLREELVDVDRGAADADLQSLDTAAMRMAQAENTAVFHGWAAAGIIGIAQASPHPEIPAGGDVDAFPSTVAKAVETLLKSGVSGPYGLAVGPARYTAIVESAEHGGYPLWEHVRQILGGPIVWAPGVRGGVVLSMRGGDFLFDSGEDLAIGYDHHDDRSVHLYLEQTFSFRVATAEAAVALIAQ